MEFNEKETALIAKINEDVASMFSDKTKGFISEKAMKEGISTLEKSVSDNQSALDAISKAIAANEEVLKAQGQTLSQINAQNAGSNGQPDIEKQLSENKDAILSAIKSRGSHKMTLKTEYTRASVTSNPMGMMLNEYGQIGSAKMTIYGSLPKIQVSPESNGVVRYIDQTLATRNAAARAESTAYPESAIAWQGYTLDLQKIGDSIPVTEESMRYTSRLAGEIELFLQTDVMTAIESNLATGDGNAPNLKGLYTSATAYTAAASGIADASIYDLIMKIQESITGSTVFGGKYQPDVVYMNITDINKYRLKKDANYNYIIPPFGNREGSVIGGMRVIETPFVTANTLVLGDSRYARIYESGGYELDFGYVNADFLQDVMTLKARKFLGLLVRTVDATGWVKSTDIAADLDVLSTVA
jgi:hypothetical protein